MNPFVKESFQDGATVGEEREWYVMEEGLSDEETDRVEGRSSSSNASDGSDDKRDSSRGGDELRSDKSHALFAERDKLQKDIAKETNYGVNILERTRESKMERREDFLSEDRKTTEAKLRQRLESEQGMVGGEMTWLEQERLERQESERKERERIESEVEEREKEEEKQREESQAEEKRKREEKERVEREKREKEEREKYERRLLELEEKLAKLDPSAREAVKKLLEPQVSRD